MAARPKAVVLGAGIIGLLTAKRLVERGWAVRVLSHASPTSSSSAAAGCMILPFFPFPPESAEFQRRKKWALSSLSFYQEYMDGAFFERIRHVEYCSDGLFQGSFPVERLAAIELDDPQIISLAEPFGGYQQAVSLMLPCVNSVGMLQALHAELEAKAVTFHNVQLDPATVADLPERLVFNCLGYGSGATFPDDELRPVFGQVFRLPSIGVEFGVGMGDFVTLSTTYGVYVGALFVEGESSITPCETYFRQLERFFINVLPELLQQLAIDCKLPSLDDVIEVRAGIRPFRSSGVRMTAQRDGHKVIMHNYGHGAHGWTLSWGSVVEAVQLGESAALL